MDGFRESQSDTLTLYPFGPLHDSKSFLLQICPQTSMRSVPLFCTANGRERERRESAEGVRPHEGSLELWRRKGWA